MPVWKEISSAFRLKTDVRLADPPADETDVKIKTLLRRQERIFMRHLDGWNIFAAASLIACLNLAACSSSKGDEEELAASDDKTEAAHEEKKLEAAAPTPEAAPAPQTVAPVQQAAQPVAPAATSNAVDKGRVVRFVNADQVDIHGQPSDGAPSVGKLGRGDRVLVTLQDGWAKINDGMFVKVEQLHDRPVARGRAPAEWHAPSH